MFLAGHFPISGESLIGFWRLETSLWTNTGIHGMMGILRENYPQMADFFQVNELWYMMMTIYLDEHQIAFLGDKITAGHLLMATIKTNEYKWNKFLKLLALNVLYEPGLFLGWPVVNTSSNSIAENDKPLDFGIRYWYIDYFQTHLVQNSRSFRNCQQKHQISGTIWRFWNPF